MLDTITGATYVDDFTIASLTIGSASVQSSTVTSNSPDSQSADILIIKTAPSTTDDLVIFTMQYSVTAGWSGQTGTQTPVCNSASLSDGTIIGETAPEVCSCPVQQEYCGLTDACISDSEICEFGKSA